MTFQRAEERGFTLVEAVMVIAILGILMSIAAPMLAAGRWRAEAGVHEVMSALGAAQRLALLRQHDVVVTFDLGRRALEVHRDANNDGTVDAGEDVRLVELPEAVGFAFAPAPPLAGDSAGVTFRVEGGAPRLVFHRNGSASEAGRVYVRPVQGSLSSQAAGAHVVTVERSTGMLQCFAWSGASWRESC